MLLKVVFSPQFECCSRAAAEGQRSVLALGMIIVFEDDQTVTVLPDLESVRLECEAVDVEDGVYRFFDELGRPLVAHFIAPVDRGSLLFGTVKTVGGGFFELELDLQDQGPSFEKSLANVVAINPNHCQERHKEIVSLGGTNLSQIR
jgi:hypothetical protein